MSKIIFYIMNSKGFFILDNFIKNHGRKHIECVVSSKDLALQKDYYNEIKTLSENNSIKFLNKNQEYEVRNFLGYKFAIGWRWLIENENNLIVFHDSLLPKYRGFAPLVNSLINYEKYIGVTALFANKEYDKGNIIAQEKIKIKYPIKVSHAIKKIEPLYYSLVDLIFQRILENNSLISYEQNELEASYSLWLDNSDYFINWSWSASKISRFVDAVGYPYDCAKAYINNEIVRFIETEEFEDVYIEDRERHIGKIIFFKDNMPVIVCNKGLLLIKKITNENNEELTLKFRTKFR